MGKVERGAKKSINHPPEAGQNKRKIKMKTLKLEVGKTYRSRKGEEVRIIEKLDAEYPYKGSDGEWYKENGSFWYNERPEDLIEEVTRHTFAIPDGVKEITLDYFGNRIVVEMVPEEVETPKPGDVMINDWGNVYIFKEAVNDSTHKHFAWLKKKDGRLEIGTYCVPGRPATPEESQPLFDALKKAGKRWSAETMKVEEIPEKEKIEQWMRGAGWSVSEYRLRMIEDYIKHKEGEK